MEELVFTTIVGLRFIVPLFIPRFPIPAILTALVLDAVDQTIFAFFKVEPPNYQSYDKALDIYYLAIAYISTIRNWVNNTAFVGGQSLWYIRLVGVLLFELTGWRTILFLFPNVFEYFFVWYEAIRLRWKSVRLTKRHIISAIAFIWIVIKLPQEYWIHIAQLDFTDFMAAANPWAWGVIAVAAAVVGYIVYRIWPTLPGADWSFSFNADKHIEKGVNMSITAFTKYPLLEKTVLVGLVTAIFLQLLPDTQARVIDVVAGAGAIIFISSFVGSWLSSRGSTWATSGASFVGTFAINVAVVWVLELLSFDILENASIGLSLFLLTLLTLIVTLYDRFRDIRISRSQYQRSHATKNEALLYQHLVLAVDDERLVVV